MHRCKLCSLDLARLTFQFCTILILCNVWTSSTVALQDDGESEETQKEVNRVAYDKLISQLIYKNCSRLNCLGKDCGNIPARNGHGGCMLCVCPIGSRARGCDKMPEQLSTYLFREGCPNPKGGSPKPPRVAQRWYRAINHEKQTDECKPYIFPLCREIDFNLWRSPTSPTECRQLCYPEGIPAAAVQQPTTALPEIPEKPETTRIQNQFNPELSGLVTKTRPSLGFFPSEITTSGVQENVQHFGQGNPNPFQPTTDFPAEVAPTSSVQLSTTIPKSNSQESLIKLIIPDTAAAVVPAEVLPLATDHLVPPGPAGPLLDGIPNPNLASNQKPEPVTENPTVTWQTYPVFTRFESNQFADAVSSTLSPVMLHQESVRNLFGNLVGNERRQEDPALEKLDYPIDL